MRVTARLALTALAIVLVLVVVVVSAGAARAATGSVVWKKTVNPTKESDGLYLCAKGPSASVYACGDLGWPDATHMWLVKYKASGARAWSRKWAGPVGNTEDVYDLVVDAAGNAYVAGRTKPASGHWDSVVLKYDAAGHLQWATVYSASPLDDEARAIGLDAAGNVYVAGVAYNSGNTDAYTAKFSSSDGTRQWTSWYNGSVTDSAWTIAVTSAGDCYAAGTTYDAVEHEEALLVKTTAAGTFAWARTWDGLVGVEDDWWVARLDGSGGVVVAGTTGSLSARDVVVARYTAAGDPSWVHTWSSSGTHEDDAEDAAVGRDGSVWVSVMTYHTEKSHRGALVKWSAAGTRRFARTMGSSARPVDFRSLALDKSGNAYVCGLVKAAGGGTDPLAVKYSPAGKLRWRASPSFAGKTEDDFGDICLGGTGYLYASGGIGWNVKNTRGLVVKIRR